MIQARQQDLPMSDQIWLTKAQLKRIEPDASATCAGEGLQSSRGGGGVSGKLDVSYVRHRLPAQPEVATLEWYVRSTPRRGHRWPRRPCPKGANNRHSFRFALAIRQPALGLTKKHNFISPNDDRKRRSEGKRRRAGLDAFVHLARAGDLDTGNEVVLLVAARLHARRAGPELSAAL